MSTESLLVLWERVQERDSDATYKTLAERMKVRFLRTFSPNNLGQLIQGTAKSESLDTKNQIRTVLVEWLQKSDSDVSGSAVSAEPRVELRDLGDEYHTAEEWKQIALQLHQEVERLRAVSNGLSEIIRKLTEQRIPLSSDASVEVAKSLISLMKGLTPKKPADPGH